MLMGSGDFKDFFNHWLTCMMNLVWPPKRFLFPVHWNNLLSLFQRLTPALRSQVSVFMEESTGKKSLPSATQRTWDLGNKVNEKKGKWYKHQCLGISPWKSEQQRRSWKPHQWLPQRCRTRPPGDQDEREDQMRSRKKYSPKILLIEKLFKQQ